MKPSADFLVRHKNPLMLLLLAVTFFAGLQANRERLQAQPASVDIPITQVTTPAGNPLEHFRQQRDAQASVTLSALEDLCAVDDSAPALLRELLADRQQQLTMEGALLNSALAPCIAVVSKGSLTIVTQKTSLTASDMTLVLTLAAAHTDVPAENIRIITAES